MKKDIIRFKLSKKAMNELRGGETSTYMCHCNTSGGTLSFAVSAESDKILDAKMKTECKGSSYSCSPA